MRQKSHRVPPPEHHGVAGEAGHPSWWRSLLRYWPVFVFALLVRCVYFLESADNPTFLFPIVDANYYDEVASLLVKSGEFHPDLFFQSFLYPWWLATIYAVAGHSILAVKIVQAMVGAATCLLICAMGSELFDRRAGLVAGLAAALYGPLIFFDGELLTTNLEVFSTALLLYLLIRAGDWRSLWAYAALGALFAGVVVLRATFAPFIGATVLWLMATQLKGVKQHKTEVWKRCAVLCLGLLAVLLPVTWVCWSQTGEATFLPASGGINLYIGNNPDPASTIATRAGTHYEMMINQSFQEGKVLTSHYERSRYFMAKVFSFALEQPATFLAGLGRKGLELVSSRELPNITNIYLFHEWSVLLRALVWKIGPFGFPFGLILPLAVIGVVWSWRKIPVCFWLFIGCFALTIILAHVNDRYRLPLAVPLLILAAQGVLELWRAIRSRDIKQLSLQASTCAAVLLVTVVPGPFVQESLGTPSEIYANVAEYHAMRGNDREARLMLTHAVTLDPTNAQAHTALADLLLKEGDASQAYEHLQQAIRYDPLEFYALNILGNLLVQSGQAAEGVMYYEKALSLSPGLNRHVEVLRNLGLAYAGLGDFDQALRTFAQALRLDGRNAKLLNSSGVVHVRAGQLQAAIANFREALQVDPGFTEARLNLGAVLPDIGQPEQAVIELQQVVQEEPTSAKAFYNLGNAQERLGQDVQAVASYEQALLLAPDYGKAKMRLTMLGEKLRQKTSDR